MDPVTAAAGLSAGASLIGGLFGSSKSKANRREARRQFNVQDEYNKNRLQYTVKDAIKAGVNPVAAIGSGSGNYSPTVSAGGDSGAGNMIADSISNAGRSISDMILKRQARQDRAIALKSANLDLESKRLQNDILRQQLLPKTQPGIVSTNGNSPKNSSWRIPMDYRLRDVGDLYLPWRDRQGNIHWFLNPDAIADADWTNIEADRALLVGVNDLSHDYVQRDGSYARKNWPKVRDYVRSLRGNVSYGRRNWPKVRDYVRSLRGNGSYARRNWPTFRKKVRSFVGVKP